MPHTPRTGWLAGVFSLLLHGLLLLAWPDIREHAQRPAEQAAPAALTRLTVRIVAAASSSSVSVSPRQQAAAPSAPRVIAVPARSTPPASASIPVLAGPADMTSPSLDTEALRAQARELTRAPTVAAAQDLPPGLRRTPGEIETPLARAIDKSARPDCRTAHAGMGLLAALPLIYDTVRDKGCKW